MDNKLEYFNRALSWIKKNTIDGKGITVTSKQKVIYPEVTGYYIPTLLQWGERELAIAYAKHLCSIQKSDGSWYDCEDREPYVFDSAQILKGLISIRNLMPEVEEHIVAGCDWILSNMQSDGRLTTPSKDAWGDNEDFCSELIHIYCLSPIRDAGNIYDKPEYLEAVDRIVEYYKREKMDRIENFSLLSHFYAYVMEGLYDLGEVELCKQSMMRLEKYRNRKQGIPGLNDVPWVCSTGMFQLALVWYKLGELERGNSLFYYALSLQNNSGGWYGSYSAPSIFARLYTERKKPYYFPEEEISWANKYFLDALAKKEVLEFERQAENFMEVIEKEDGRYQLIKKLIEEEAKGHPIFVCDVGCGKGRYLKNLVEDLPDNRYYATDISSKVVAKLTCIESQNIRLGSMTKINYESNFFELVYSCEAFEHAINLRGAVKELYRIVKPGGKVVIIDKPVEQAGKLELYEWEQWINTNEMVKYVNECGGEMEVVNQIPYENKNDGLFRAWIIKKL